MKKFGILAGVVAMGLIGLTGCASSCKDGSCGDKKDASMGAVKAEDCCGKCDTAGKCTVKCSDKPKKDAAMGAVSGEAKSCASKASGCSSAKTSCESKSN